MKNTVFLQRTRIVTVLSAVYDFPLTILEAPMGYGKTTAVRKFIEAEKLKPFWFGVNHVADKHHCLCEVRTDTAARRPGQISGGSSAYGATAA